MSDTKTRGYRDTMDGMNKLVTSLDVHLFKALTERDDLRQQLALAQADSRRLREALSNMLASALPGMNWTDETGQLMLTEARQALDQAVAVEKPHG